ncbi:hypothetical protein PMAYCL1PPCAC_20942, partial [Pristionchus mayeri]
KIQFPPHFFNGTIGYSRLNNYSHNYDYPVNEELKLTRELVRNKTNFVLGVVSNCWSRSEREDLIDELSEHLDITAVGRILGSRLDDHHGMIIKKSHRFVLGLENSFCFDYVTEKAFRFKELIVPIVRYRRQVEEVIPSDAFIAIDDFESIVKLKEYLEKLMKNDDEYMKYFEWFNRAEDRDIKDKGICKLCTDLHV